MLFQHIYSRNTTTLREILLLPELRMHGHHEVKELSRHKVRGGMRIWIQMSTPRFRLHLTYLTWQSMYFTSLLCSQQSFLHLAFHPPPAPGCSWTFRLFQFILSYGFFLVSLTSKSWSDPEIRPWTYSLPFTRRWSHLIPQLQCHL